MAYNFGPERRKGSDRRATRNPAYAGVERRLADRRDAREARRQEREGPFSWIVAALILFVLIDTVGWDGYYRHALVRGLNTQAESVRDWSASIWDWGSTR